MKVAERRMAAEVMNPAAEERTMNPAGEVMKTNPGAEAMTTAMTF